MEKERPRLELLQAILEIDKVPVTFYGWEELSASEKLRTRIPSDEPYELGYTRTLGYNRREKHLSLPLGPYDAS